MAGDWIPWSKGLSRKLEVLRIAQATGRSRREVACLLMEFWEWADNETEDGFLVGMDVRNLSALHADTDEAFWSAVIASGWLTPSNGGVTIPHFDYWLGRSAKRRLKDTKRKGLSRSGEPVADVRKMSASDADKNGTTGQDSTSSSSRRRGNKGGVQGRLAFAAPVGQACCEASETLGAPSASANAPPDKGSDTSRTSSRKRLAASQPRDDLFDAVVEVTASDPRASGSYIGRICKSLREADPPYTPAEVRSLPGILQARGFSLPLTPGTVEKYVGWTRKPPTRAQVVRSLEDIAREQEARREASRRDEERARREGGMATLSQALRGLGGLNGATEGPAGGKDAERTDPPGPPGARGPGGDAEG